MDTTQQTGGNYSLALAAARELAAMDARGEDDAKIRQLKNDIDGWVGTWTAEGKLVWPAAILRVAYPAGGGRRGRMEA